MTKTQERRVASYQRTSKDDADPARQRAEIDEWASGQGVIVTTYQDIGGRRHQAGDAEKRPEWNRLWDHLRDGQYDTLVVSDTSRLGFRDEWELLVLAGQLRKLGVALIEARSGKTLNGSDIASIIGTGVDGHHHASHVRDLAINTLRQKSGYAASHHAWQGGQIPLGMMVACRRPDGTDRWTLEVENDGTRLQTYADGTEVRHPADYFPKDRRRGRKEEGGVREHLVMLPTRRHPERLEVVRLVFSWFQTERVGPAELARRLEQMGHTPPGPPGTRYYYLRIRNILQSPSYTGQVLYGRRSTAEYHTLAEGGRIVPAPANPSGKKVKQRLKDETDWQWSSPVPGFGEPIIPMEEWLAVQTQLTSDRGTRRPKSDKFLFSGLVYCGKCGSKSVGIHVRTQGRDRVYYRCSAYIRRAGGPGPDTGCGAMDVNQARIVPVVDQWLGEQADAMGQILTGDERLLLSRLMDQRSGTLAAIRDAFHQIEKWMASALELVATPTVLPDGRRHYEFPVADGEVYRITLPGCESRTDILDVYHWLSSASESTAREQLRRLEAEHERLFQALLSMPTAMMRQRCQAEIDRVETALITARAGQTGLRDQMKGLLVQLTQQSKSLSLAKQEIAGSADGRRARIYADLVERITFRHELKPHGKRIVYKLVGIEVTGKIPPASDS